MWHYLTNLENSRSSPGQEEVSSEGICWDGERFAPSKLTNMLGEYCLQDKETDVCRSSQFGMTSEPSTEENGQAESTSFQADSLARTSVKPVKGQELMESEVDSGLKCSGWFAKWDRDSCLWRIPQCSLLAGSDVFLETWPRWGSMRSGVCWEVIQEDFARTANVSGCSLMRPIASDAIRQKFKWKHLVRIDHPDGNLSEQLARVHGLGLTPLAAEILMSWPETWTDLKPLATDKFQQWQRQHLES